MSEQLPTWCHILDEWLARAEHELKESEKGTAPAAPNNKTTHPAHAVKVRGDNHYE